MIRIDCTDPRFHLAQTQCGEAPTKATLSRWFCQSYDLAISAVGADGSFTVGPVPDDIRRGVWTLSFDTPCGCFTAQVFVDVCTAPAFTGKHTATPDTESSQECCL